MNFLITGAWQQALQYIEIFESLGHRTFFMQWEKDPLPCDPEWVEAIIGNSIFLTHSIDQFKNLKYIQLTSAGFDRVPMDYIKSRNITIYNARGVYSIPMAEYALTSVLYLYKQMDFFYENQKNHNWVKNRSMLELTEKKVLIVGCGSVGIECAKRFSAFGCHVVGINRRVRIDPNFERIVGIDALESELIDTDILLLTVPLCDDTFHMIGKKHFKIMKDTALLVNIARGAIVDQDALSEALNQKLIGGAVMDVFEEEPLPENNCLWKMEHVIITPHNSFESENNGERLSKLILHNIQV